MSLWIESHVTLGRHPKLIRLAEALGTSRAAAMGHLHYLWHWSLVYTFGGDLSPFRPKDVSHAAEWDGDPEAFIAALKEVGFLDADGHLHDWQDYAGRILERRAAERDRKRKWREKKERNGDGTGTGTWTERATLPDLTLPTTTPRAKSRGGSKAKATPTPILESLECEAFKSAWTEWRQHRREARKPLTPTAERKQLAKLAAWGPDRAVEAIGLSISNGWAGIFEAKQSEKRVGLDGYTQADAERDAELRIARQVAGGG